MFTFPDAMSLTEILSLAVASILVNNYILVQFPVSYTHLTLPTKA